MRKIILIISLICLCKVSSAQINVVIEPRINVAMAAVGIVNAGVEFGVSKHSAVQLEYLGSFAGESFLGTGYPFIASVGYLDYKYYIKKNLKGFYFGTSLGYGTWKMNRGVVPFIGYAYEKGHYDVGSSMFLGLNIGYKFLIKERWGIELNVAGGWAHSNHEGYNKYGVLVYNNNRSDEFLPFKGGVYISYRLGVKKNKK